MKKTEWSGISFAPVSSEITLPDGQRAFAVDPSFLAALMMRPSADNHRLGWDFGRRTYETLERDVRSRRPSTQGLRELAMPDFQTMFSDQLAMMGWGRFELKKRDDFLFIDVHSSPIAEGQKSIAGRGATQCAFLAGFFASIFSSVSEMDLDCIEVTCHADGYDWCSFLLDNKTTVRQVRELIQSNYAPLEAFQKMKSAMGSKP